MARVLLLLAALAATGTASAQTIERVRLTDNDLTCPQLYAEAQQMDTVMALHANTPSPAMPAAAPASQATVLDGFATAMAGARANPAAASMAPGPAGIPAGVYGDPGVQASIARARAAGYTDAQINAMLQMSAGRAGYPVNGTTAGNPQLAAMHGSMAAGAAAQQAWLQQQAAAGQPTLLPVAPAAAVPAAAPAQAATAAGLGGLFGALAGRTGLGNLAGGSLANAVGGAVVQAAAPAPAAVPTAQATPAAASPMAAQARARKDHLTSLFLSKGCKLADMPR